MLKNPTQRDYFNITIFNLAPSLFWAVMLLVLLQKRIEAFVPTTGLAGSMAIIIGAGGVVSIVTQIVVGAVSDRHQGKYGRRRPYLVVGAVLSVPAMWMFVLSGNFVLLVLSFMLLQLFTNIAQGPYQALIPDLVPPERHGIASAYMGLWLLVGQAGGLILAAVLLRSGASGITALFVVFTGLFVGLMLVTALGVREEPYEGEQVRKRHAILAIFRTDLRSNPSFVWALVSRFLINLGFYIATFYLMWYVQFALGFAKQKEIYTLILGLIVTAAGLAGTFPAGRLADAMSKKTVIYVCCTLCILASILFVCASSMLWAIVAAAIFGLGLGAFAAVDWALACNVLPEGDAAKFLGIWSLSIVFPQMAAALVGSATVSLLTGHMGMAGVYRAVMGTIVPFMIVGTLTISMVREKPVGRVES
jgi:Na+/melibiose symporter-like transporter